MHFLRERFNSKHNKLNTNYSGSKAKTCQCSCLNKFNFLRLFDNPLSKYFIFKRISCMQGMFWVI